MKVISLHNAWEGQADCRRCALRNTVLFAGLNETDFEKIHEPIDQYFVPAGTTLYQADEDADFMYTIRSGVVKLVQLRSDGTQRIVRLGFSSDVLGMEALFETGYQHDAIALHDTEVCRLPVSVVNKLSVENHELHTELLKRWHLALNEADIWLTQLSTGSAKQRMANLLLKLSEKCLESQFELFGREDIGSMLAITTETASRVIAEFKRNQLMSEKNGSFSIDTDRISDILSN